MCLGSKSYENNNLYNTCNYALQDFFNKVKWQMFYIPIMMLWIQSWLAGFGTQLLLALQRDTSCPRSARPGPQ